MGLHYSKQPTSPHKSHECRGICAVYLESPNKGVADRYCLPHVKLLCEGQAGRVNVSGKTNTDCIDLLYHSQLDQLYQASCTHIQTVRPMKDVHISNRITLWSRADTRDKWKITSRCSMLWRDIHSKVFHFIFVFLHMSSIDHPLSPWLTLFLAQCHPITQIYPFLLRRPLHLSFLQIFHGKILFSANPFIHSWFQPYYFLKTVNITIQMPLR